MKASEQSLQESNKAMQPKPFDFDSVVEQQREERGSILP
jgi:hypothetical protein